MKNYKNKSWFEGSHQPKFFLSKEFLNNEYWKKNKSFAEIAKEIGCCHATIQNYFNKYKLSRRPAICPSGSKNGMWKGGRTIDKNGYIYILSKNRSRKKKYIAEHTLVMEKYLNRFLSKKESVHHKDGNKHNNNISNLKLFSSEGKHQKYEALICLFCKQLLWGKINPSNRKELLDLFNSFVKEHR